MAQVQEARPWDDNIVYWVKGRTLNDLWEMGVIENELQLGDGLKEIFRVEREPGKPQKLMLQEGVTIADCETE
jgi:hypothetical protein